jgi:hypothetical protein
VSFCNGHELPQFNEVPRIKHSIDPVHPFGPVHRSCTRHKQQNGEELEKIDDLPPKSRKRESIDQKALKSEEKEKKRGGRELSCIHGESRWKKYKLYLSTPWI